MKALEYMQKGEFHEAVTVTLYAICPELRALDPVRVYELASAEEEDDFELDDAGPSKPPSPALPKMVAAYVRMAKGLLYGPDPEGKPVPNSERITRWINAVLVPPRRSAPPATTRVIHPRPMPTPSIERPGISEGEHRAAIIERYFTHSLVLPPAVRAWVTELIEQRPFLFKDPTTTGFEVTYDPRDVTVFVRYHTKHGEQSHAFREAHLARK